MHELRTSRLLLRQWRDDDLAPYAAMNTDTRSTHLVAEPLDPT